jgi:hypothetical protein
MLLSEAKEILKRAGYIVEDTDTLEHEIEDHVEAIKASYANNDREFWKHYDEIDDLEKKANGSSLLNKIANAKQFNKGEDEEDIIPETVDGAISVLNSLGLGVKKEDVNLYPEDDSGWISFNLGRGKFGNTKVGIHINLQINSIKKGKFHLDLSLVKCADWVTKPFYNDNVPEVDKNLKSVKELKPIILKYIKTVVEAGFKEDKQEAWIWKKEGGQPWIRIAKKYGWM